MPQPLAPLLTTDTALSATVTLPKGAMFAPTGTAPLTVRKFREAASQTYDEGELVSLDSSGFVTNLTALADPTAGALSELTATIDRDDNATLVLGMVKRKARYLAATSTEADVEVILCEGAKFYVRFIGATADVTAANMGGATVRGNSEVQDVSVGEMCTLGRYAGANIAASTAGSTVGRDCQTVILSAGDATATKNYARVVQDPSSTYGGPWAPTSIYPGVWIVVDSDASTF